MFLFDQALDAKEDPDLVNTLDAMRPQLNITYALFGNHFSTNTLEVLVADYVCADVAPELDKLYLYGSATIRSFKTRIELAQPKSIRYVCQYCTLNHHDTFDHFLPQSEFPEFGVHPFNLLPACSNCNRRKSSIWRNNGQRTGLNLYIDALPDIQYIFVDIFWDVTGEVDFSFRLSNDNGIDPRLFNLLTEHYSQLNLLKRLREAANSEFSGIFISVFNDMAFRNIDDLLSDVRRDGEDMRPLYGFNYWKAILQIALGTSDVFRQALLVHVV